jgi:hypothetical protein
MGAPEVEQRLCFDDTHAIILQNRSIRNQAEVFILKSFESQRLHLIQLFKYWLRFFDQKTIMRV